MKISGVKGKEKTREELLAELESMKSALSETEKRAQKAEIFWKETFDSLPDMVTLHDRDFNIVMANKAAEKILLLPQLNVTRAKCFAYFHGKESPPSGCPSCDCLNTGKPASFEIWESHLGRYLEIKATPTFDEKGSLNGLIHVVRDITERKRAEERIFDLLRELKTIFDTMPIGIAYLDTELRFIRANKALCDLSGLKEEDILGKPCYETIGEYAGDHTKRGIEKLCSFCKKEECRKIKGPTVIERPMGDSVLRVTTMPKLDDNGNISHFLEIFEDITERKRAEERLVQTMRELERSNRDLEQFAYVASHDLREPLRVIVGFVQLLSKRYKGRLDADADEYIEYVVDGANRMNSLIGDLLAYSRMGADVPVKRFSSETALEWAIANLKAAIEENVAVVTHDPLPEIIYNDNRLSQLFQNLIGNAIKFRGKEPPHIHVSAERGDGEWRFSVDDNGVGIAPQHKDRVFEIFQRLHGRGKYPGTGIGLAICKKMVENRGGRIWVESEPGKGATFYFTIPDRLPGKGNDERTL